jgi:uncharacterized membrane protein YhaH (DUF805 family)
MDTDRLIAAVIRFWWATLFPAIGGLVVYLLEPGVLEEVGITNGAVAVIIGGVLYGLKKLVWPDTRF